MKKKQVSLRKKLTLGKSTVAALTAHQQQLIAGGAATTTVVCQSRQLTCATRIRPTGPCQLCELTMDVDCL